MGASRPRATWRGRFGPLTLGRVLLAGLAIREAFSFWTGHPFDFESWIRTGYVVSQGQNPYSAFWPAVPGVSFSYLGSSLTSAAYLPAWPMLLGGLYRVWEALGGGNRFVLYFLLKQPGILADVASAYLLYHLVVRWTGRHEPALAIASYWSFFPYAILVTAVWGQFDSIVVVILLALLYARGPLERNLLDGLGIFVKWLTVIFLPLEAFRERGSRRLGWTVALLLPGLLTLLAFALEGWSIPGFTAQGLGSVGLSETRGGGLGMNFAFLLTLGPVTTVLAGVPAFYTAMQYLWVPGVVIAGAVAARWVVPSGPEAELRAMLFVLTVFFLLRWGLYEQYFVYLFALLALDVAVFHPGRSRLLRLVYVLSFADLIVNNDFLLRFLSPIDLAIPPYTAQLDASPGYGLFRTVVLAIFAFAITVTLVELLRTFLRDDPAPRPWPARLVAAVRARLARGGAASLPAPAVDGPAAPASPPEAPSPPVPTETDLSRASVDRPPRGGERP